MSCLPRSWAELGLALACVGPGLRPGRSARRAEVVCSRSMIIAVVFLISRKDDHPLFVTFNTDRRWQLPPAARDIVLECCLNEHTKKFDLHAAVVMPDHVHLIYSPLRRDDGWSYSLPEIMKAIKGKSCEADQCGSPSDWPSLAGGVLRSRSAIERQFGGSC
jgi:REP element-mobilizing transposase RayT